LYSPQFVGLLGRLDDLPLEFLRLALQVPGVLNLDFQTIRRPAIPGKRSSARSSRSIGIRTVPFSRAGCVSLSIAHALQPVNEADSVNARPLALTEKLRTFTKEGYSRKIRGKRHD
jgi:hypothetical protein